MPYSKKHNVLFLHIPKCAGKSFEVALNIATKEEVSKYKWRSFVNRTSKFMLVKTSDKNAIKRLWGMYDISLAAQHLTYAEIELLNLLESGELEKSIKVAIIRNPYDRAVSSYNHMKGRYGFDNFLDFAKKYYKSNSRRHNDLAHKRTQIDFLRDKRGNVIVDNLIRFENLNNDFELFKEKYSINCESLPFIGKQTRKKTYKDYYCKESKNLISEYFKEDIEIFNYIF